MSLLECQKNQRYTILEITTPDSQLKERLLSFGIAVGVEFVLLQHSLKKATFSIAIDHAQIALRASEAQHILVRPL
ncbi:FeoA family protein [Helicobacter ailurogastricus]|uniref:Ferrous iron transporter FeoA-like domain-containing protein n=1 Tax=Helicobacter ailurogastricus TaxID=1578720 RepID=A0A0K2Y1E5_9HELI|nr:FeoA family protein [Helicobacter ailurogastricus]CRF53096.1 hypothetical protein HAL07_15610 [Helicobacter ailurogastricus]BDQ28566.1 hypothetical protein ASB7_04030 [Helicobacter ailurogastricus]GLH58458.1 hypothetical protein NHP214376_12490 [Helicobacter ailurogastricus]GLH59922.1 hypothetical protein NHP214377_11930 [Helicobacter ailurogastricus]GMB91842.1 hypothetical protein NHP190009_10150 [Helicobacter ailurogastricus]